MKPISGKKLVTILKRKGWIEIKSRGSHFKLKNPVTEEIVTIPVHSNKDLKPGLQNQLMKETGLKEEDI